MENVLEAYFNTFHWIMWISLVIASVAVVLRLFPLNINRRGNNLPNEKVDRENKADIEEDTDEDLERRGKEAKEQAALFSQELESMNRYYHRTRSQNSEENAEFLWEKQRQACEEKRNLALMVSSQVQSRKTETSFASETLRLIQGEMEHRTKVLENEKNDLQRTLEKEIDRWSIEWASMLEKFKFEERRMRKRMKDLAEKNVELQREVSSLNKQEINANTHVIDDLRMNLRDAENEILQLKESLSESIKKTKQTEDDRDSNKRSFREKEREYSELQKSVVRLQQLCINQQKTIDGFEGSLRSSNQKEKELMVLVGGQEKTIRRLLADLQECLKSMMLLRGEIPKISEERDRFQQETGTSYLAKQ